MKLIFVLILFSSTFLKAQNLLPEPNEIKFKEGKFSITNKTKVRIVNPSLELNRYVKEFITRFEYRSGVNLKTHELQDTVSLANEIVITTNSTIKELDIETNEAYNISVSLNKIVIDAENNIGAYRALETLLQLIITKNNKPFFRNCVIVDKPRFKWRGLLIDVCRHWIPLHILKRNIDAMAAVKLNVLHLHLTDDQGFRIESKKFPKLHRLGNDGNYFSQNDIKTLVKYAKERGVRVVPEFDIPSHTRSWFVAYPKLSATNKQYELTNNYGIFNASLNPSNEYTYQFLDTLLTEMCQLFPDSYFHIGGDENKASDWSQNKKIQKFMAKENLQNNEEMLCYFVKRVSTILKKNKKTIVGWDDIFYTDMPKDALIQSWRGKSAIINASKNNFKSILSDGYYLDKTHKLLNYYENDPLPQKNDLSEEQKKLILGGEATMWTEIVDKVTIESRIWPSTLAIAERLWSLPEKCNTNKFYDKVSFISNQLQTFGLTHLSYQKVLLSMLSNNSHIETWRQFIMVLEPVRDYKRHDFLKKNKTYSTFTPLNRIADACYVESFTARNFNKLVLESCKENGYCQNRKELKSWLVIWAQSAEKLLNISSQSTALFEVQELALKVQELCELSWRKINSPSELSTKENQRAKNLISHIDNFNLDVRFAPIDGIKIIFD